MSPGRSDCTAAGGKINGKQQNNETCRKFLRGQCLILWSLKAVYCASMPYICRWVVGKPARLIIRLLFGFDSNFDKLDRSTNSETAMLPSNTRTMAFSEFNINLDTHTESV